MVSYWLNLFTGKTWEDFKAAGAKTSGFREKRRKTVQSIQAGDILLCYITGIQRWAGALRVVGHSKDDREIWSLDQFPARLDVEPVILLDPKFGVPMDALEGKVDFYQNASDKGYYKAFLRGSPSKFKYNKDAEFILGLLQEAKNHPISREYDQKLWDRVPLYKASKQTKKAEKETLVSIPEKEDVEPIIDEKVPFPEKPDSQHITIQYYLLNLGAEMGLDVWVARNDRSRTYKGQALGSMPKMVNELPTQFNEATQRTIELIDVLWLKGNSILAAFEVESTTSIYSGLLRMSDLVALQPNIDIKLYLVASDEKRDKVKQEILRPTFEIRQKPLSKLCGFLPFTTLIEKIEGIQKLGLASSLSPDFLLTTAEYFDKKE